MKLTHYLFLSLILPLTAHLVAKERPNVVLIYGDDVGYGDVGAYGSEKIPTPHIDKLAAGGIRFTDGHCTAATCTPSRFSMLSGVHGFRHGVRVLPPNARLTIPTDWTTLPRVFKRAGYHTGIVGKWHLGLGTKGQAVDWNGEVKPGPLELGFDSSFLLPSTNDRVPCVYLDQHKVHNLDPADPLYVGKNPPEGFSGTRYPDGCKNREAMIYYKSSHGHNNSVINGIGRIGYMWGGKSALWDDEAMTDTFVERTRHFLAERPRDKPFFLFYSAQDIHVPRAPHPRFHGKTELGYRGDAMVQFDWAVGEIMGMLEKEGLTNDTVVIFSSDNGPVYDDGYEDGTVVRTSTREVDQGHDGSGIYRGGKYQIYEGGTRVPFIVSWPGKIKPGVSSALVSQIDLLASFASMFGQTLSKNEAIDSRNTLSAFLGKDTKGVPYLVEEARGLALREGPWKFIPGKKPQLYHLGKDPGEKNNIAAANTRRAASMAKRLEEIRQASDKGIRGLGS